MQFFRQLGDLLTFAFLRLLGVILHDDFFVYHVSIVANGHDRIEILFSLLLRDLFIKIKAILGPV